MCAVATANQAQSILDAMTATYGAIYSVLASITLPGRLPGIQERIPVLKHGKETER